MKKNSCPVCGNIIGMPDWFKQPNIKMTGNIKINCAFRPHPKAKKCKGFIELKPHQY